MYQWTPTSILAMTTMVLSTLMALSSTNWIMAWMAMEINLLSFIPLMCSTNTNQETEGAVKYFLAQAIGSAIMLMASMYMWSSSAPSTWMVNILAVALMLKLGAAPCHFWLPAVMASISWNNCLLLVTWQKVAPLFLMCYTMNLNYSNQLFLFVAALNAIIGGAMGLNQTQLRSIMAYSSITHMGWMLSALTINNPSLAAMYLLLYSMITGPLFMMMNAMTTKSTNQFMMLMSKSTMLLPSMALLLLSLAGLPPLTGFLPKWIMLSYLAPSYPTLILLLLIGSYMNLYFYLNIVFNASLSMTAAPYTNTQTKHKTGYYSLLLPASTLLGIIPMTLYALTMLYKP